MEITSYTKEVLVFFYKDVTGYTQYLHDFKITRFASNIFHKHIIGGKS